MTPLLAKALLEDREGCRLKAPRAIRRILELAKGEPRGLLRDLLSFVITYEAVQADLDRHLAEVAEVVEELEEKVKASNELTAEGMGERDRLERVIRQLNEKIKGLEVQVKESAHSLKARQAELDRVIAKEAVTRMERDQARRALESKGSKRKKGKD